jgi:hypothetical protein
MRVVSTRVLPVPAPASTSTGPSSVSHGVALLGIFLKDRRRADLRHRRRRQGLRGGQHRGLRQHLRPAGGHRPRVACRRGDRRTRRPARLDCSQQGRHAARHRHRERARRRDQRRRHSADAGRLLVLVDVLVDGALPGSVRKVELTGLSKIGGRGSGAEFVAFNDADEIAVTLQENNHIAIVDAKTGKVTRAFLGRRDRASRASTPSGRAHRLHRQEGRRSARARRGEVAGRRPPGRRQRRRLERRLAASPSSTRTGTVAYESGNALDGTPRTLGHYPDARNKKGVEPEGLEVATFGDDSCSSSPRSARR